MQLLKMPLFEIFLPIIQSNKIQNWTAKDFWKLMKLSKKDRNRFNRQRMYRILCKLVEFVFLVKKVNDQNYRFSIFSETAKLNEIRNLDEKTYEASKMKLEELKLNSEKLFLEKQTEKYVQLEQVFPSMKIKFVMRRKHFYLNLLK